MKLKKDILIATILYFSTVLILLSAVYWFMLNNGFTQQNFLISAGGVLIVSIGWGYILSNEILAPKQEMDEKLLHITKDIIHELNIPLATITANTSMIKKSNQNNDKTLKRLNRIENSSIRLKKLYNELVYSINREIKLIPKEEIYLKEIIQERVEILDSFNRNKFELDINNIILEVDKIGFEQMIDNILNNAMKYSDKNSTIIIKTDDDNLLVIDKGIGIDESQLVQIFERYYQINKDKDGEGIGLNLVKRYCDEMKIEIKIKSQKNIGTTIILGLDRVIKDG